MKNIKTIVLSLLLAGAAGTVMAQDPPQKDTTNFNKADSMNRFNAGNPDSIKLRANRDSTLLSKDLNESQAAADSIKAATDSINAGNPTGVNNSANLDSSNVNSSVNSATLNQANADSSATNPTVVTNPGNPDSTNNNNSNNASSPSSLANPGITDSTGNATNAPANVTVSPSTIVTDSTVTAPAPAPVTNNVSTMPATTNQNNTNNMNNNTAPLPRGVNVVDAAALQTGLNRFSALPILNTYVPEAMVTQLKNQYGDKLYDITMLKTGENQYGYAVRTQENGTYKFEVVNDAGTAKPQ